MPDVDRPRRIRWGWLAVAAVVGLVALFYAGTAQSGACYDSVVPGGSYCVTGADVVPVWVAVVAAVLIVTCALIQALRRRR